MSKNNPKAVIPARWKVQINVSCNCDSDKVAMYEFMIDFQTQTPPPEVKCLPAHLQTAAATYIPQMQEMKERYLATQERMKQNRKKDKSL